MSRLLTAEELAERWQVKVAWVYAKTWSGEIPRVPLPGRYYRYRFDVIEEFEKSNHDGPGDAQQGVCNQSPRGRRPLVVQPVP